MKTAEETQKPRAMASLPGAEALALRTPHHGTRNPSATNLVTASASGTTRLDEAMLIAASAMLHMHSAQELHTPMVGKTGKSAAAEVDCFSSDKQITDTEGMSLLREIVYHLVHTLTHLKRIPSATILMQHVGR